MTRGKIMLSVLVGLLVLAAITLSTKPIRAGLPFESLLAVASCGVIAIALFQLDRLG